MIPNNTLKGILHPEIKILSSFMHPHAIPDEYDFLSSEKHKFLEQ